MDPTDLTEASTSSSGFRARYRNWMKSNGTSNDQFSFECGLIVASASGVMFFPFTAGLYPYLVAAILGVALYVLARYLNFQALLSPRSALHGLVFIPLTIITFGIVVAMASSGLWRWLAPELILGQLSLGVFILPTLGVSVFLAAFRIFSSMFALELNYTQQLAFEKLRITALERSIAISELKTLQAQIEPHFLYNVLANVQSMITHAPATADAMLTHLIDYLKYALPSMRSGASTLHAELDLARSYLAIAQLRFGDRLTVTLNDAQNVAESAVEMPPMLLMPIVENAIRHGVEGKPGAVHVEVQVQIENHVLTIRVIDDGPGFKQSSGSGIGVANVRERLTALYGDRAFVNVVPREGGGVVSTLCIPVIAKNAA
jgi:sensor histidine kinase YesM